MFLPGYLRLVTFIFFLTASCGSDRSDDDSASDTSEDISDPGEDTGDAPEDVIDGPEPGPCELADEPTVELAATLSVGRYSPIAFKLADGTVLVAGGYDFEEGIQNSAEIFDPTDHSLSSAGSLRTARNFASWVTLGSGEVLVTGGFHPSSGSLTIAELYDPLPGSFDHHATMSEPREAATATLLEDGRVLVAGGLSAVGFVFHRSAEIYSDGAFETTGEMSVPRAFHASVLLPTGEVIVIGGDSGSGELASAEIFDPASSSFRTSGSGLTFPAKAPTATLLEDGRVLVAGGANSVHGTLDQAWLYDPEADTFETTGPMNEKRMAHTAVLLMDGRVLVAGGWSDSLTPSASTSSLEIYDPPSGTWELLPVQLGSARHDHVMVLLDDCMVLVTGGQQVLPASPPVAPRDLESITVPLAP